MTTSPIGEEASRLAAALEEWLQRKGFSGGLTEGLAGAAAHVGGSAECTLCPICQLIALARGTSPEVWEHLAAAASSLTAAVTSVVETRASAAREWTPVQHVDVD